MRKTKITSSNYDFFLKMDTSKYKGEWIAISENKIIAHGQDAQKVYNLAKKKAPTKDISLAKTPQERGRIFSSNWLGLDRRRTASFGQNRCI